MFPSTPHAAGQLRRRAQVSVVVFALLATLLASASPTDAAPTPVSKASKFVPVSPVRVLDTRTGVGVPAQLLAPGGSVDLDATWAAPAGAGTVTAVVLNVTATDTTGAGYVQVYPTGSAIAGKSSNLNIESVSQTIANLVVSPVGTNRQVTLYTQGGGHLIANVFGFFVASQGSTDGRYVPITPRRLLDTRTQEPGRLAAATSVSIPVRGAAGIPLVGAAAVALNVTAMDATGEGFVQVIPTGGTTAIGASSNITVDRVGQTVPNLVIVPIGPGGGRSRCIRNPARNCWST